MEHKKHLFININHVEISFFNILGFHYVFFSVLQTDIICQSFNKNIFFFCPEMWQNNVVFLFHRWKTKLAQDKNLHTNTGYGGAVGFFQALTNMFVVL